MSEISDLGTFLAGLETRTLPPAVLEAARLHVLDSVIARTAGYGSDVDRALSRIHGDGPGWEAVRGAALAHCHEIDDIHDEGILCIGGLVVPAALAFGRARGASGAEVMAAIVAGYEAMGRFGLALGSAALLGRGWWPSAVFGAFGSAAAAGKLLRLSGAEMVNALAIAGMHSGGLMGGPATNGRHLLYGSAARTGLLAAEAAAAGLNGPAGFLAESRGLGAVLGREPNLSVLVDSLGKRFIVAETSIKPYGCARQLQGAVEMILDMRREGITSESVEQVRVEVPAESAFVDVPVGESLPATPAGAAQWVVALAFVRGRVLPADLDAEVLMTQEIHELARRVQVRACAPGARPRLSAALEVRAAGETIRRDMSVPKGGPARPMTAVEVTEKARSLGASILGDRFSRLVDLTQSMEQMAQVDEIAGLRP